METHSTATHTAVILRTAWIGLTLAVLTILYGQALGIVFGLNEDLIRGRMKASAMEVQHSVYHGDDALMKSVLDKSWTYMQRAHLHAGGMGTSALALIVLLCLTGTAKRLTSILSALLGAGGLGYSTFWMWAGFRAPSLGSTGAAKESLWWLAMPSSGAFVLATAAVLVLLATSFFQGHRPDSV